MEKVLYLDDNQSEILAFKILELKESLEKEKNS